MRDEPRVSMSCVECRATWTCRASLWFKDVCYRCERQSFVDIEASEEAKEFFRTNPLPFPVTIFYNPLPQNDRV